MSWGIRYDVNFFSISLLLLLLLLFIYLKIIIIIIIVNYIIITQSLVAVHFWLWDYVS